MGVRLYGSNQISSMYIGNQYIIVVLDYMTKWVEMKVLRDITAISTVKFHYENIIRQFDYLTHLVGDQRGHFT
jgi:hypothetical protein